MAAYKLTLVALMMVVCAVCIQNSSAITCYSCSSDSSGTDYNSCGADPSKNSLPNPTISQTTFPNNSTVADCAYCTTTVYDQGGFSRSCVVSYSNTQSVGCAASGGGLIPSGRTCYCNTDKCNTKAVMYGRGSLSCYVCSSVDFFDNGCGATLDSSSIYVKTVSGCTACSKFVAPSTGGGSYSRGCLYTASSSNTCASNGLTCNNRCESNLCNTASSTTTQYPILLAVVCAIYGVSFL